MDYGRAALADRLAAEYVAGLLRGPARRRFESLLPAHAGLRAATRLWQERLLPLTAAIEPQAPSPTVWPAIEARLHGSAAASTAGAGGWWRQLAFWRGCSALTGLAAVALALLLANPSPVLPPIIVVLSPAAAAPGATNGAVVPASFVASISPDGRAMVMKPLVSVSLQADRSLELWSLPPQGAPRSLGVIAADQATVVKRSSVLRGTSGFAVSLEPVGGSPTGAPTGPVLYVGKLTS